MSNNKSIVWTVISRLAGLLLFLILLAIANKLTSNIPNEIFAQTVYLLNANLNVIIIFSVILFLGELFATFKFPFNFPYPIFNALGSIFLVKFIIEILKIGLKAIPELSQALIQYQYELMLLIATIVLIVGYMNVFVPSKKPKPIQKANPKKKQSTNWSDVENELKELILFFSKKIRKANKKKS